MKINTNKTYQDQPSTTQAITVTKWDMSCRQISTQVLWKWEGTIKLRWWESSMTVSSPKISHSYFVKFRHPGTWLLHASATCSNNNHGAGAEVLAAHSWPSRHTKPRQPGHRRQERARLWSWRLEEARLKSSLNFRFNLYHKNTKDQLVFLQ